MDKIYIDLINRNSKYIDNDDWETVYTNLLEELDPKWGTGDTIIGEFTSIMLHAGLNPLGKESNLTYVPNYYGYGETFNKIDFPEHLNTIGISAYAYTDGYTEIKIPGTIDCVNVDAFRGCSAYSVEIEDGCIIIGEEAFADCSNLKEITIPKSCSFMHDDIFRDSPDVIIKCYRGSRAESYAKEYDIEYEWID